MNGVTKPSDSAGSNQRGTIEMLKTSVIWPAGAWPRALDSPPEPSAATMRRTSTRSDRRMVLRCSRTMLRDEATLLEHETQPTQVRDVLQRIAVDDDEIGELARLDGSKLGADAAELSRIARGGEKSLPGRRSVLHPQAQLEQRCLLQRPDVRAQRHPHTGCERSLEPLTVLTGGVVRALTQVRRQIPLLDPSFLPWVARLVRGEVADRQRGDIPGVAGAELLDALLIHDVAVLDAVRAEPNGLLHRFGSGGMRHHTKTAGATDCKGRLELLVEQERLPVAIPGRAHDPAREIELDVVDAVLDLLPDRADKAIRAVAFERMTRRQEVATRAREEVAGREHPRAHVPARVERAFPGHVHEVRGAGAPHAYDARLGERLHQALAKRDGLVDHIGARLSHIVGMNMDIPEPRQEIPALEVDHLGVPGVGRMGSSEDFVNPSPLDHDAATSDGLLAHAVDDVRVGQHKPVASVRHHSQPSGRSVRRPSLPCCRTERTRPTACRHGRGCARSVRL